MSDVDISPETVEAVANYLINGSSQSAEKYKTASKMLRLLRTELTTTQDKLALSKQANEILVEGLKNADAKLTAPFRDDAWLIFFEDQDVRPEVFTGEGSEAAARQRYANCLMNWTCHLFRRDNGPILEPLFRAQDKDNSNE